MQKTTGYKLEPLFWGLFSIIPIALIFAVLHAPTRGRVRNALNPDFRKVLSQARGDILGNGDVVKVLKIRTRDALFIEVYNTSKNEVIDRFPLEQTKDGHFTFRGEITNLAIEDIDGDLMPEILAPTFDESMNAHLNVYKYNPVTKAFFRLKHDEHPPLVSFRYISPLSIF